MTRWLTCLGDVWACGVWFINQVTEVYPPFNPKEAPSEARLVEATLKKQLGNNFFHHEDWTRAIRCYQSAVKSLDPAEVDVEEEGEQVLRDVTKVYCDISNNLAMALMKLDRHKVRLAGVIYSRLAG